MYLQEEYLLRHGFSDVPLVNHMTEGSLLLKMDSGYLFMTIAWKEGDRRPGKYHINYYTPVHNGHDKKRYFNRIADVERQVEFEEYYGYISSWAKGQIKPVEDDKAVILAIWEIFIFCCDSMIVELSTPTLEKLIYKSVDEDLTQQQRFLAYQECLVYISIEFPSLMKIFKNDLLGYMKNYCHWLAKLINYYKVNNCDLKL